MSRVASRPVELPKNVEVKLQAENVMVKGPKGALTQLLHADVSVEQRENALHVVTRGKSRQSVAIAGTTRALLANMCKGVSVGFERKLTLHGVGYRAQAKGKSLNLVLGFSHAIDYDVPEGITVETPSQTEIVVRGVDKQQVGQVAADIRSFRPPEPYKGKGVRYADEHVAIKEAKKK